MLEKSTHAATRTFSCAQRLYQHMLGLLLSPSKSTVTNMICTKGGQHSDWSADYRLYSKDRVDESVLLGHARETLRGETPSGRHIIFNGDGSFTNKTILRGKPENSTYVGRTRKDMVLHYLPEKKGSKMLYRKPAYIVCTDPDLAIEKLLQYYLWRWGIEVNFREEKTLIGTGEAQVRTASSNQHLPAVTVAAYAALWTTALQAISKGEIMQGLRPPKWRKDRREEGKLPSTGELIRMLRYETWAGVLRPGTFYHFATNSPPNTSEQKPQPDLPATLFSTA